MTRGDLSEALRYCLQRKHRRRSLRIALVVGVLLTIINHSTVNARGDATWKT